MYHVPLGHPPEERRGDCLPTPPTTTLPMFSMETSEFPRATTVGEGRSDGGREEEKKKKVGGSWEKVKRRTSFQFSTQLFDLLARLLAELRLTAALSVGSLATPATT